MPEQSESKGTVRLAARVEPPLTAGDYSLTVSQSSSIPGCTIADACLRFSVRAEQIRIDPAQLYSCYPPRNAVGVYGECLPHVVLHRPTLPWERNAFGDPALPWVALLVFAHDEGVTVLDTTYAAAAAPVNKQYFPGLNRQGLPDDEACRCLDIPRELFEAVVPHRADLPYLAHTRHVSLDDKVTDAAVRDGSFSCVVANRYPRPPDAGEENAVRHEAHLVSLEGFADYLADPEASSHPLHRCDTVRMFSLLSWEFWCTSTPFDFAALARKLGQDGASAVMRTCLPEGALPEAARRLLALNAVPLNHDMREGSRCVAWYRPPLLPQPPWDDPPLAAYFADSSLLYDPETGMMDISLQAAWQLGRLLALQNEGFARQLIAWRLSNKQKAARQGNRFALAQRLGSNPGREALRTSCQQQWEQNVRDLVDVCGLSDPAGLEGKGLPLPVGGLPEDAARADGWTQADILALFAPPQTPHNS